MRLIRTDTVEIEDFFSHEIPPYAILSHRWAPEEVTLQDVLTGGPKIRTKKGFLKLQNCCTKAKIDGFKYVWIDTCCIDKTSSAELSESLNSMYLWYCKAELCYAYLGDIAPNSSIKTSEWFTRGWTLQELLAPENLLFLDQNWGYIGTKSSLQHVISNVTGIPADIVVGAVELETASVAQRMSWAARRRTTRLEDAAYCLMGIFGINMSLLYGEGENAFIRLQHEIMRTCNDQILFSWESKDHRGGLLATSAAAFANCHDIVQLEESDLANNYFSINSIGILLDLPLIGIGPEGHGLAVLNCMRESQVGDARLAIHVKDTSLTMIRFKRVLSDECREIDMNQFSQPQYAVRSFCIETKRLNSSQKTKSDTSLHVNSIIRLNEWSKESLPGFLGFGRPTALVDAARDGSEDLVWLLLTRGDIIIDAQDGSGRTALSIAAECGHGVIVNILIKMGADVNIADEGNQKRPLHYAAENGYTKVVKALLHSGSPTDARDKLGQSALWKCASHGHERAASALLNSNASIDLADNRGSTPLIEAAIQRRLEIAILLIKKGCAVDSQDIDGRTALHYAAENGLEILMKFLLQHGSDINIKDKMGFAPISLAIQQGHTLILQLCNYYRRNMQISTQNQIRGKRHGF